MPVVRLLWEQVDRVQFSAPRPEEKRPSIDGLFSLGRKLSDGVFEAFAGSELWDLHCRDLDLLRGVLRIHAHAGGTIGNRKRTEACDVDFIASSKGFGNHIHKCSEGFLRFGLAGSESDGQGF